MPVTDLLGVPDRLQGSDHLTIQQFLDPGEKGRERRTWATVISRGAGVPLPANLRTSGSLGRSAFPTEC